MTYKLLIVDDSKLARMSAAKALNALYPDWTRVEAATADEAVSMGSSKSFDIALLDFNMPGRDGLQLAAELKAANPSMPIAIVSANHQEEIVARAKAIGATFLQKPLTQHALGEFLQIAVGQLQAAKK
ncbi:response regulator [Bradyrhizobium japonicum]|uniref:response regulator transcription factor n=1 Tax=Bradyrhizobium japonicum TaxID=375 RepID=UPI001BAD5E28|nr:response regulator [Bradyrhizobium japonicum]MBR0734503.1 response regulator [Bradyrhizobium japonicum]